MVWSKSATAATAFGQTVVGSGPAPDQLARVWTAAQGRLPDGWRVEALRCASTGPSTDFGSTDWTATAVGPAGEEQSYHADDAVSAREGLAASFDR